jgi:lysophospholipase L1-like esterase
MRAIKPPVALAPGALHFDVWAGIGKMRTLPLRFLLTLFALLLASATAQGRTVHIVAFGDSATEGWLVARDEAYPAQLQALLRKKGYDVSVTNEGISGDTTAGALKRFDAAIAPGTDIVLVEFGINDLRQHVSPERMRANLNAIVKTLRQRKIDVLLIGLGSLDLAAVARANSVPYAQWKLPPGKYRARDNAHFSAEGYAILLAQTLRQIEELVQRAARKQ